MGVNHISLAHCHNVSCWAASSKKAASEWPALLRVWHTSPPLPGLKHLEYALAELEQSQPPPSAVIDIRNSLLAADLGP